MTLKETLAHPFLKTRYDGHRWLVGQPDDVFNAYIEAMGLPERKRGPRPKAAAE